MLGSGSLPTLLSLKIWQRHQVQDLVLPQAGSRLLGKGNLCPRLQDCPVLDLDAQLICHTFNLRHDTNM